jgi:hypothetical protein
MHFAERDSFYNFFNKTRVKNHMKLNDNFMTKILQIYDEYRKTITRAPTFRKINIRTK